MSKEYADKLQESMDHSSLHRRKQKGSKKKEKVPMTSLLNHIEFMIDWLFGLGLILAVLKDVSDIINNALIAAGGAGLPILVTLSTLSSVFLIFTSVLTTSLSSAQGRLKYRLLKKIFLITVTFFFESFPLLSIFPWESIITAIIYWMTLKERQESLRATREQQQNSA